METKKIRNKIVAPAIFILFLILVVAYFLLTSIQNEHIIHDQSFVKNHLQSIIKSEIREDANNFIGLINIVKDDIEIQNAWHNKSREDLLSVSSDWYKSINQNHRISHFYFHNLDQTNFLRVHAPHRFGDTIDRHTLHQAIETQQTSFGVEIGTFGHLVLRIVSPWVIDGELVGYIELGEETEHILEKSSATLDTNIVTVINKEALNKNEWISSMSNLTRNNFWDALPNHVLVDSQRTKDFVTNQHEILNFIKNGLTPHVVGEIMKEKNDYFFTGNFPIIDVSGKNVGAYVFFSNISEEIKHNQQRTMLLFLSGVTLAIVLFVFYYYYVGRIEHAQQDTLQQLQQEVIRRTQIQSELITAKEFAEQASQAKSEFLSAMSHELRTPMNAVLGFSQLLEHDSNNNLTEDQQDSISQIKESGKHLLSLINNVLDLAKIESGHSEVNIGTVNGNELLEVTASFIKIMAKERNISIHNTTEKNEFNLKADQNKLKQVLFNFASNAVKYNDEGGVITLSCTKINDHIRLSVSDNGEGVPETSLHELFEPFNRLNKASSAIQGTGIGLTICNDLVALMNGKIGVFNNPDKGLTFWVEFEQA